MQQLKKLKTKSKETIEENKNGEGRVKQKRGENIITRRMDELLKIHFKSMRLQANAYTQRVAFGGRYPVQKSL